FFVNTPSPHTALRSYTTLFRSQRLAQIFAEWRRTLIEALARGQARGELRADCNPERAAHFLVAALEGAILMTKVTKDIGVMEKCVDELKQHLTLYAKS